MISYVGDEGTHVMAPVRTVTILDDKRIKFTTDHASFTHHRNAEFGSLLHSTVSEYVKKQETEKELK